MDRSLYDILGVDPEGSIADIREAYRQLAKHLHPDVNKSLDAPERMRELNAAHETLSDATTRKAYDRFCLQRQPIEKTIVGLCWVVGSTGFVREKSGIVDRIVRQGVGLYNVFFDVKTDHDLELWIEGSASGMPVEGGIEYAVANMVRVGVFTLGSKCWRRDANFALYVREATGRSEWYSRRRVRLTLAQVAT